MTGVKKGVVLGLWVATLVAVFVVARVTAPPESTSAIDDFGTALRAALAEKDGVDRAERTASLLQRLDSENVPEAAATYSRMINILDEHDIRPFALAWARFDPAAALDHAISWPFQDKQKMGAGAVIEGWAMKDPTAAREAYEEIRERLPGLGEDMFVGLLAGWLYSGKDGLDEFLAGLSRQQRDTAITKVAARLMRIGGPEAMMSWADSIVRNAAYEKRFKRLVFRRGIRMVGRWYPERAAAWAMEHAGQDYAIDAPRIVAGLWGRHAGLIAMQWVRDHPDEETHELAVREAFRTWFMSDPKGAVAWLESETPTAFHDPAIIFYAKDLNDRDPETAIGWCERIHDSDERLRCLRLAAAAWYQRDAVAAETWLQQSPLDEEARRFARTPPEQAQAVKRKVRPGQPPSF
ncbi:MAG: hypothetical protein JRF15_08495 [Deltaproteobacteria bacterium]|jgi:hypothetical protein|nr:hypothetical protein [Deltaproteobacteria bacterium]